MLSPPGAASGDALSVSGFTPQPESVHQGEAAHAALSLAGAGVEIGPTLPTHQAKE